jgi:adenosyl cobinamide kinase/adenosyl cobinamide phosphate guanylyltransferase
MTTTQRLQEVDKRLSSHEAACNERWRENYRRLESIESQLSTLNTQIRVTLITIISSLAAALMTYTMQ